MKLLEQIEVASNYPLLLFQGAFWSTTISSSHNPSSHSGPITKIWGHMPRPSCPEMLHIFLLVRAVCLWLTFSQRACSGSQTWKQSLRYTTRLGQQQPESLWTGRVPRHPWQLDFGQYLQQHMVDVAGYSKWYSDTHLAMLEKELCECVGRGSDMVGRGQMEYFRVSLCPCICSCSMNDVNEYCLLNNIK